MAILDGTRYTRCRECNKPEFKIEDRCVITENANKETIIYNAETYKAIVCSSCGEVHDTIKKYDSKVLIEN